MAKVDERLARGRAQQKGIEEEKLMPEAKTERDFECSVCGKTTTARTQLAMCIGVDFGVLVRLPDGKAPVYKNGLDDNGNPITVTGEVVKIGSDDVIYSHDGKKYLDTNDAWVENLPAQVPGEHVPTPMTEVK